MREQFGKKVQLTGSNPTLVTATIANGTSLSQGIDLEGKTLLGIHMPAGWDATSLTFQVSEDGVTYDNLYDNLGNEKTIIVANNRYIYASPSDWVGIRFIKVRSGTSATPVNQTANRNIILITKAV
jgi:hypothetical protein